MTHAYTEQDTELEVCPHCRTKMRPLITGLVDGGQPYPDTVSCSACGKVLRQDDGLRYLRYLGYALAVALVGKVLYSLVA